MSPRNLSAYVCLPLDTEGLSPYPEEEVTTAVIFSGPQFSEMGGLGRDSVWEQVQVAQMDSKHGGTGLLGYYTFWDTALPA